MKRMLSMVLAGFGLITLLHAAPPADPSLLLWLPFDEGAGTLASDLSTNALEAELTGVRWAKGAFGTAAWFGGTNSFIELPPVPGLNGATQFTISAWAAWEGTGRYPNLLTTHNWSPGGLMLFVSDDSCSFRMGRPDHRAGVEGEAWTETGVPLLHTLPMRKWVHLCVVFSRPEIATYVDGRPVGRAKWDYPVQAGGLRLGAWGGPASHRGLLDDVRIHGRALSAPEAAQLAQDPARGDAAYTLVDESRLAPPPAATLENSRAILTIDTQGRIVSLRNRASGRELLASSQPLASARLKDGRQVSARKASYRDRRLVLEFPRGLGAAELEVETRPEFFLFTIRSLTLTNVESLTFFSLSPAPAAYRGGMANMVSDDTDAVCLRGLDLPVEMACSGPGGLRVWTTAEHGLTGARAGLAAGPKADMPAMLRAMAEQTGVPHSKLGGPWSLGAEANRGSYLFADLSHASTDEWIDLARRGGFTTIHIHGWWATLGHYGVNTNLFPNGLADFKDTVARIHAAGLRAGIHTLTACIDPRDAWITPEASPHLIPSDTYTLARALSPTDTVIRIREKPSDRHDVIFSYSGNGNAIRIGSEIVQYAEVLREPPYGFAKCTRGAFKTRPAAHAEGERADYLQQRYIAFYPEPDSPLAGELAGCIANVYNTCKLDQIYFDGSEGMMSRYGIDAMRRAIFRRLDGDPLTEASCHGAHSWWFHARLGAWDHPVWAAKRFQDRHIETSSRYRQTDLLEPQMGWWAPRGPSSLARGHRLDEMEYFAAKNLGLDSAMSIQGVNVTRQPLPPYVENQIVLLGWYERLRLARHFDTQTVARVAVPGDEFRLRQDRDGAWRFTPVRLDTHRVGAVGNGSERWTARNAFAAQPLAARIEALYAVEPSDHTNRRCVSDFADPAAFRISTVSPAVTLRVAGETADVKGGDRGLRLSAANRGAARTGAWARASLPFPAPYRNLSGTAALGVWVKGDGSGALLNLQLGSPREYMQGLSDHLITLDFTGWRYVELLMRERDAGQMTDFLWPYGGAYHTCYRTGLDMAHISEINLYLNNLPEGGGAGVVLGPIVALPVRPARLERPSLTVNGRTLVLPVTLASGDFLELERDGVCTHHNEQGDVLARLRPAAAADWPALRPGDNEVVFDCVKPQGPSARVEVTIDSFGEPFGTPNPRRAIGWKHVAREYEMTREITEPDGGFNAWDVAVRPGEEARLEVELAGGMASPALTVDGRTARFPATLKDGQRLVCRDAQNWVVLDAARVKVAEGRLEEPLPALKGGGHRVAFACEVPDRARVRLVKVYE